MHLTKGSTAYVSYIRHIIFRFFLFVRPSNYKVTSVTTTEYKIYLKEPTNVSKALGQSLPQELEVGLRSGPYLLITFKWKLLGTRKSNTI